MFEFNSKVYRQKSGTAIGTKFAPPYTCIYMDEVKQKVLETQSKKALFCWRYKDEIFFIWNHGEQELEQILKDFNNFNPNLSFTHETCKNCIPFLDVKVKLIDGKLETDCTRNLLITSITFITYPLIPKTISALLFIVKLYASINSAL